MVSAVLRRRISFSERSLGKSLDFFRVFRVFRGKNIPGTPFQVVISRHQDCFRIIPISRRKFVHKNHKKHKVYPIASGRIDLRSNTCDSNTMKVTTKGQVTVPVRIRDYLGIAPHSDVDFRITDGAVVLVKHEVERGNRDRFSALRGVLKGVRTTQQWMRETRGD